jgi:hypothetical protein
MVVVDNVVVSCCVVYQYGCYSGFGGHFLTVGGDEEPVPMFALRSLFEAWVVSEYNDVTAKQHASSSRHQKDSQSRTMTNI